MRHVRNFNLFEGEEPNIKPTRKYQGFCLTAAWNYDRSEVASIMITGSYLTIQDFMYTVWEQLVGDWDEDEDGEFFHYDISDLMEAISNWNEVDYEWEFWSGLEPKSQKDDWDSCSLLNPGVTSTMLNSMFSNISSVMLPNTGSDYYEVSDAYIAKSVANKPELISRYAGHDRFSKIKKMLGWTDDQIELILNYYINLRGMI